MVSAELGTKRTCPSCGTRFYDLLRNPIVCPHCGVSFVAEARLPSKGEHVGPVVKVRESVVPEPVEPDDVELVSLEDVEEAFCRAVEAGEFYAAGRIAPESLASARRQATRSMQQSARVSDTTTFFYLGAMVESGATRQIFTAPRQEQTEAYLTGRFG